MPYFSPDYFDSGWFDASEPPSAPPPGGEGLLSVDDYFDCDYFDPTYFDTPDCNPVSGSRGGRVVRLPQPSEPIEDPDELLALI